VLVRQRVRARIFARPRPVRHSVPTRDIPTPRRASALARYALPLAIAAIGCTRERPGDRDATGCAPADRCVLAVSSATTLAQPFRVALDSFAGHNGLRIEHESGGSLELARRLTELDQQPDLLALADVEVFPALLVPAHADWYLTFARNRMVLAYTERSRGAAGLDARTWRRVLLSPGVEVARSDPDRDPMGYRTLLVFQLAERHYGDGGLASRLTSAAPLRHVRARSSELVALLQAGEVDYAWTYESVARAGGLRYLALPPAVDLSSAADSATYAEVRVRVPGATRRDTVELRGAPIRYALTIPRRAPHAAPAERFVAWLIGPEGRQTLARAGLEPLDVPVLHGAGPAAVQAAVSAAGGGVQP
jgi:molybdate/tungstate transport system substrate-binding protein